MREAAEAQVNTCLNVTCLLGLQYKGPKHFISFKFRVDNQSINNDLFLVFSQVSHCFFSQGSPANCSPISDVSCMDEKKSFVYSEGNRSLLTHPPQLLVSQHNGWMITPHKNQSTNIYLSFCWVMMRWELTHILLAKHTPSKNHKRQNTNKNSKSHWNKLLKLLQEWHMVSRKH